MYIIRLAKKNKPSNFSYGDETRELWKALVHAEQKRVNIRFDLENDDSVDDEKVIPLDIKGGQDKEYSYKAIVRRCQAGGDWQSPNCYFRCQIESQYDNSGPYSPKFKAIVIPIKGNVNLIKSDKGYTATDTEKFVRQTPKDIKLATEEMKKELVNRIKAYWKDIVNDHGKFESFKATGLVDSLLKLYTPDRKMW